MFVLRFTKFWMHLIEISEPQLTISYMSCFTTAKNEQQLRNEKPVLLQIFCAIYFNHLWSHHVTIIILPDINSAQSWFDLILSGAKGQIKSEWVYEIIDSPK